MKKIFAILLASMLTVSAVMLTSCGEKGENETNGDNSTSTVTVTVTNALEDEIIVSALVDYEENMTVLEATILACASNGVSYEINEETNELISISGLVDFLYSDDAENANQWIYTLNGKDVSNTDGYTYNPSENIISTGDVVAWEYNSAADE